MSQGEVKNPETDGRIKDVKKYKNEAEIQNLEDLFKHLLQDMLYAENAITKALPKMIKNATNVDVQAGFEQHLDETKDQINKLGRVFEICGYEKKREKCDAIEGLLKEGESLMEEAAPGAVLDSAIIVAGQKIQHYEIASYGALCNMAKLLGQNEVATILHEILEQEKATDMKLIELSDSVEEQALEKAA